MALDYDLDLSVSLETEPKFSGLYKWCLQETNEKGQQVGQDCIPHLYTVNFYATSLTTQTSVATDWSSRTGEDDDDDKLKLLKARVIRAKLKLGLYDDSQWWRSPPISMFGSSRKIEDINLRIVRVDDVANESCSVWGTVAYEGEFDFRNERTEDCLEISIYLENEKFESLFNLINRNEVDRLSLSLSNVKGFYSEWSPSISPAFIKVLENSEEQGLLVDDDWKEKIPTLGNVDKFSIAVERTLSTRLPEDEGDDATSGEVDLDEDDFSRKNANFLQSKGEVRAKFYERALSRISKLLGILIVIELVRAFF